MSAYVSVVISISAIVGICCFASYNTDDKAFKGAMAIVLIYTLASPTVSFFGDLFRAGEGGEAAILDISVSDTDFAKKAEEAFCVGVRDYVSSEFGIDGESVKVVVMGFDALEMRAERIRIILYGEAVFADNRAISEKLNGCGFGKCEVEIGV